MEKSSFFNSVAGDRKYKASDFASYFNSLLTNGVFPNPSTNLQVISNSNMTVTVKAGKAWINGYCYINDSDLILPITVADGVLKRIDRIVIQFNTINRNITAKVKKGIFASSPVALPLQRDADAFELGIADILISNGVASISQANITDLRMNTTYCGWVNSLIQADTTAIFNQYQAWFTAQSTNYNSNMSASELAFNTDIAGKEAQFQSDFIAWFDGIKGQLSGDIAGNLTNLINTNTTKISNLDAQVTKQMNDLKSSVDNGKNGIYSAIVGKKITPTNKDFTSLVAGVNAIKTGAGNATEDKVASGSTFTNADGILRTGNVPLHQTNITPSTVSQAIPKGMENGLGIVQGVNNALPSNIKAGVNIAGVVGNVNVASLGGKRYAEASAIKGIGKQIIIPFPFEASTILIKAWTSTAKYYYSYNREFNSGLAISIEPDIVLENLVVRSWANYIEINFGSDYEMNNYTFTAKGWE